MSDVWEDKGGLPQLNGEAPADLARHLTEVMTRYKAEVKNSYSVTNVIVCGAAGCGKSTLVNAVFGRDLAEVGVGKPITREIRMYEVDGFPITITDTRGIELLALKSRRESGSDPVEDLRQEVARRRSDPDPTCHFHQVWLCVSAASRRIEPVQVQLARELGQYMPVMVVLTQSWKNPDGEDLTFPDEVAKEFLELRQTSHRDVWGELPPFPIFVLRAKAYREDDAHGLHEFVMKSSDYFTAGHKRAYIRSQIVSDELKQSACADIIASAVKASVACGLSPVPFSSALLLIPIEVRMIIRICSVYELELDDTAVLCIAGIVTGTLAVTALFPSNAVKTIPLFGSVLGGICEAVVAAAACRVVGEATVLAVNLVRTQLGTALLRSAPVATWFPIVHRVLIATIKRQYQNADLPMDPVAPPAE